MTAAPGRYTVRQAVAECQDALAVIMVLAALMCLVMAFAGWPVPVNAVVTGLFGPGACITAVLGQVWRKNR